MRSCSNFVTQDLEPRISAWHPQSQTFKLTIITSNCHCQALSNQWNADSCPKHSRASQTLSVLSPTLFKGIRHFCPYFDRGNRVPPTPTPHDRSIDWLIPETTYKLNIRSKTTWKSWIWFNLVRQKIPTTKKRPAENGCKGSNCCKAFTLPTKPGVTVHCIACTKGWVLQRQEDTNFEQNIRFTNTNLKTENCWCQQSKSHTFKKKITLINNQNKTTTNKNNNKREPRWG